MFGWLWQYVSSWKWLCIASSGGGVKSAGRQAEAESIAWWTADCRRITQLEFQLHLLPSCFVLFTLKPWDQLILLCCISPPLWAACKMQAPLYICPLLCCYLPLAVTTISVAPLLCSISHLPFVTFDKDTSPIALFPSHSTLCFPEAWSSRHISNSAWWMLLTLLHLTWLEKQSASFSSY